jgi:hypothetical protein
MPAVPADTSTKLRLTDVRRAFRLIGEIRQHGADPQQWRPHLLRGLIDLLDADLVISSARSRNPMRSR